MKTAAPPRFVQTRFRLIRRLPLTRLRKIEMERKLINDIFRHRLDEARTAKEHAERIESIHRDHWYESDMLNEEEEYIRSNTVIAKARRLDLPIPTVPEDIDDDVDWQVGQYFYKATLSRAGRQRLREAIRKEKKERHDGWTRWLQWLTPVIAIGGIFATILTRK